MFSQLDPLPVPVAEPPAHADGLIRHRVGAPSSNETKRLQRPDPAISSAAPPLHKRSHSRPWAPFTLAPERFSRSLQNRFHLPPESANYVYSVPSGRKRPWRNQGRRSTAMTRTIFVFVDLADRWGHSECGPVGFQHKSRDVTAACSAVGFSFCLLTLRAEGPEWDLELDSGRWACFLSESHSRYPVAFPSCPRRAEAS